MNLNFAEKVVIITEKIISREVCLIAENCGATGYTIFPVGGKGSRNVKSTDDGASLVDDFLNVKIEIILNDRVIAERIMSEVTEKFFQNYSGITFIEKVEIVRPKKFEF